MADANLKIRISTTGAGEVTNSLKSIASAASSLKSGLMAVGAAVAAASGLSALGSAALGVAKLGGELSDLSSRTGISTRSLIVLRQAFQDAGVGAESVGKFVNLLQKNLVDASENGGAAADALSKIGLSASELLNLNPGDQFTKVSEAISNISDPAQRASAAMSIFGKSAGELLPLFADGGALTNAERVLGKMPDVLARNVPILDNISDAFDRLPNKSTQLFAGIFDQIGPTVQALLDAFESIDLTAAGQKIGAFVMVAINEFKAGRFGEFIGLTIEAGFEIGLEAAGKLWEGFIQLLGTGSMWAAIGNALLTTVNESLKAIAGLILNLIVPLGAIAEYAGDALGYAFQIAVNALATGLEKVINAAAGFLNEKLGTSFGQVSLGRETGFQAPDLAKSFDANKQGAEVAKEFVNGFFDESTKSFRQLTGTGGFNVGTSARNQLGGMLSAQLASREGQAGSKEEAKGVVEVNKALSTKEQLLYLELDFKRKIQGVEQEKGRIEASWLMTSTEKYQEKKKLLEEELSFIRQQIAALQIVRETADAATQAQIDSKIVALQGQYGGVQQGIYGMGADPQSYTQQFAAAFTSLREQAQITAATLAQTFADVFNSAIQSISNGITGLIMGTMTWAQALRNIATSILTSIVSAIVSMGVRWIATQILMATVGKSIMAAAVAASAPIAAAQAAVWATPATLATIASYGAAASAAPGFIAASQGIVMAQSMAMFKEGGYTGDGNPDSVAGIVHRGEYVMPADAVDRIGIATLEAMRGGATPSATSGSTTGPSPITLNMGVFDDPRRMADWARSSDGRTVIVDIVRQHAHEFSRA